jgi:hypothetical protein
MGWSYGWSSKKNLVRYLQSSERLGQHHKLLSSCLRGNCLWQLIESEDGTRWIGLDLLGAYDGEWGYKDMDESMGPNYYSCPLSYLDKSENNGKSRNEFATSWRAAVREHHAKKKPAQKLAVGQVWALKGVRYPQAVQLTCLKPLRGRDTGYPGMIYRLSRRHLGEVL